MIALILTCLRIGVSAVIATITVGSIDYYLFKRRLMAL